MTVYPGAIPLDINILQPQRNMEIAIGFMLRAAFGTNTVADGLACIATSPASMSVTVGPGSILVLTTVDTLAAGFGSLALDNADSLMKIGVNLTSTALGPFTAPTTAGQSQAFLVEASFSETDGSPVVLPYYNATNPLIPYSGPANTGAAQNTARSQRVSLQVKAGTAATTGSQVTPSADIGWIGLWVITIANGNTTLVAGNITTFPAAPFIPAKLGVGSLFGFSHQQAFTASGNFTVPNGVTTILRRVWGAGGGGAGGFAGQGVGGGGGGAYSEGLLSVTPGQVLAVVIGTGGAGGVTASSGANGAASSVGGITAGGGLAGNAATPWNGGNGGAPSGGTINFNGAHGGGGATGANGVGGYGGSAAMGGGGDGASQGAPGGQPGNPGGGGAGGGGLAPATGGPGANGFVVIEW